MIGRINRTVDITEKSFFLSNIKPHKEIMIPNIAISINMKKIVLFPKITKISKKILNKLNKSV